MIKSVTLSNFQKHKKKTIEFTSGVNCITGDSDRGKSSIYRAIRWVLTGKPKGDSMITHGKKQCTVTIQTDKGIVTRGKGKENYYEVNGKRFNALGSDIPLEVKDVLHTEDINFQSQHDPHFLLADTAGEVGKLLNKSVNLDVIDKLSKELNKDKRHVNSTISFVNDEIEKIKTNISDLKGIKKAVKLFDELIESDEKNDKLKFFNDDLKSIIDSINHLSDTVVDVPENLEYDLLRIERQQSNYEKNYDNNQRISKLIEFISDKKVPEIPEGISDDLYKYGIGLTKNIETKTQYNELRNLISYFEETKYLITGLDAEIDALKEEIKDVKICKECGQEIK